MEEPENTAPEQETSSQEPLPYRPGPRRYFITGILGLIIGVSGLVYIGNFWRIYVFSSFWEKVPAHIEKLSLTSTTVGKGNETKENYTLKVQYTYTVEGKSYTGTRVTPHDIEELGGKKAKKRYALLKEAMDAGKQYEVLVNPRDPEESIIFRSISVLMWFVTPFVLFFLLSGVLMIKHSVSKNISGEKEKGNDT
jgi:hypothetical protein